ncbi:MAG: SH3 domain-containing protein [Leptolyngbyaceae cyanobacterium RU_5_1]|nr:SH3 domain-containing protein [Leptolyngbyaceae cyanobacterium RU_5_1]
MTLNDSIVSIIRRAVSVSLATAAISLGAVLPVLAQPAMLVANQSSARINVRSQPTTSSQSPHYGLAGDRVEVLRSTRGQDGYIWHYVQFNQSGAKGWVRADLVSLLAEEGCKN